MMILIYVLVSIPFVAIFILLVKAILFAKMHKYKTLLFILQLLSGFAVMGSFGGPIILSTFIKNEELVYGIQWYSTSFVFLGNMMYLFILARKIDKEYNQ